MTTPLRANALLIAAMSLAVLPIACTRERAATADDGNAELLAKAARRLQEIGYAIPDGIRCEAREANDVIADLDGHQDLFLPADSYALQHALLAALGLPAGRDADALRQQTLASMARGLSAYYDPLRKVFVLLPSATRDMSEALSGSLLPLITHELVHAHQDARDGGLAGWFGRGDRSMDAAMAGRIVIEGEAEIAAVVACAGEQALASLAGNDSNGMLDSLFAGELTGKIYAAGRQLALARHRQGGFDAIKALWTDAPPSSEQAMHPLKYGRDLPTAVTLPPLDGLTVAGATTIGELITFHLLRQAGVEKTAAAVAAAGWDGDRLAVYDRGNEREVALVWRSVWDRDEDATDFAGRLSELGRGEVVHDGRVVDWVHSGDDELQKSIVAACAAMRTQPAADDEDAASTAAVEAELAERDQTTAVDGELWRHEHVGLAVPIPAGWEMREINGVDMVVDGDGAAAGFSSNINVIISPRGPLQDLDAMVNVNRRQLEQMKLEVPHLERARRGDVDIMVGEYTGKVGASPELHFLMVGYLRGDQQVIVTLTTTEELWRERQASLRQVMAGIGIDAP